MTKDEAARCMIPLTTVLTGWTPDAVEFYVLRFMNLTDPDALMAATTLVAESWAENIRPKLSIILDAYAREVRRREMARALPSGDDPAIPPGQGVEIARRAYTAECHRLGRDPNYAIFDRWMEKLGKFT